MRVDLSSSDFIVDENEEKLPRSGASLTYHLSTRDAWISAAMLMNNIP